MYLKSNFIIDFVATVPAILFKQTRYVYLLRIIHIHELKKSIEPLRALLLKLLPTSRIARMNFELVVEYSYFIVFGVHYFVCFWLWMADGHLVSETQQPW